jgi:hypothetical protein
MRTIPFKEVLWSIAYKAGLDPAQEFLADEGESLASYINAWARRTWDSVDFPEWTTLKEFTPDANHQVPYQAVPVGANEPVTLSRPLKVYLVDPRATPYPIDTRFRVWDEGLHVGFDHGASVWIKYMPLAPRFTSIPWDSNTAYGKGDLAYSPDTGECYRSLVANNLGKDPVAGFTAPLSTQILQPYVPPAPPDAGQSQLTQVTISGDQVMGSTVYALMFRDLEGGVHTASYDSAPTDGLAEIVTGLAAAITGSSDPWFGGVTLTVDTTLGTIQIATGGWVSTDASMSPGVSTYWEWVPFPYALAEPVIRGAYGDALREAGQTDKAMAEEQATLQEGADRVTKALAPGYNDLTDQRAPAPRYRGKLQGQGPPK